MCLLSHTVSGGSQRTLSQWDFLSGNTPSKIGPAARSFPQVVAVASSVLLCSLSPVSFLLARPPSFLHIFPSERKTLLSRDMEAIPSQGYSLTLPFPLCTVITISCVQFSSRDFFCALFSTMVLSQNTDEALFCLFLHMHGID